MNLYSKEKIRTVVNITWPAIMESFFTAFAGLIDSLMVSSIGASAVASVGLTTQPKFIGLSMFVALNVSVSALVARRRGERRRKEANQVLFSALLMIIIAALIVGTVFTTFAGDIIRIAGSTSETHAGAVAYFKIIMGGMIFNCIQMGINSAQRGAGNTKITMRTNMVSNIINIILNYILIHGKLGFPQMGIRGAALATVLGTVVASVMSICSICKADGFISIPYIIKERIKPSLVALGHMMKLGYGVFLEQILMRVGFVMTALMIARQGMDEMAAHQVAMNVLSISFSFGDDLQAAAVALSGRCLGENKPDLAKEYGGICRMIGVGASAVLTILFIFGGHRLMEGFFEEENIVAIGARLMWLMIPVVIFQIQQMIYMGILRGAGDTLFTAIVSMVSVTVIRTMMSYIGCYVLGWGIVGIWMGIIGDQVARFLFAGARFRTGKWTQIKI